MNAQLLNPFTIDIPDSVSSTLETAECTTCLFNHGHNTLLGQYLAVGRSDGYITIWDIETKSVLRLLAGHVRPITGLAWSSGNRYLASCSGDWNVVIWDLKGKASGAASGVGLRSSGGPSRASAGINGGSGADAIGNGSGGGGGDLVQQQALGVSSSSERKTTIRFDSAVSSVQFAPGNSKKLVVVLSSQQAFLVDVAEKIRIRRRKTTPTASASSSTADFDVEEVPASPVRILLTVPQGENSEGESTTPPGITAARFTPDSQYIVAGTSKGGLLIFSATTGELIDESKVLATNSGVKELAFDAAGRFLVVNCNDRAIRVLSISTTTTSPPEMNDEQRATKRSKHTPHLELTLLHKIQDMIQRTAWSNIGFSPSSSDYIFAGAAHKAAHNVYIWDLSSGTLVKILEGPKDWLIGVDWHPARPMLASVSNTGAIYVWFTPTEEIWSAYAPGFEELDENREYEEREDEFDFVEDGDGKERRKQEEEEAAEVRLGSETAESRRRRQNRIRGDIEASGMSEVRMQEVWAKLDVPVERRKGKWCQAFEKIAQRLKNESQDSGWLRKEKEEGWEVSVEEMRELVFEVLDDDGEEMFVIPPRLEVDYSDFHDDHL